ncbi:helix-turn-helix transcriptional regulator [Kitasatospora sp. GP30]|uniref:helix-turn-helix domain-containing protein n=1 Tax=Kitasatospora sp. GP30 TaxID=3035084 RepID=UPI000C705BC3|nr:helix-turn-helix transcriptional regulator [Kitasatospora sp. GP30]
MNRRELHPDESPQARFGAELRRMREEMGWTQEHLAELTGYSSVHISAVETGRKPPTERFAGRADVAFGTGKKFLGMCRDVRGNSMIDGYDDYLVQEAKAGEIRVFEIGVIPGLLQTPEYTEALVEAGVRRGLATREKLDEWAAQMLARQQRLRAFPSPLLHAVLDESCLRRPVGGRKVMANQLAKLEECAHSPGTIIQVAPYSLGEDRPLSRAVHLLTLPERRLIGYSESQAQGHMQRDPDILADWDREYHRLQVSALSEVASVEFVRAVRKELE